MSLTKELSDFCEEHGIEKKNAGFLMGLFTKHSETSENKKRIAELEEAMKWFVNRCDKGEVRSVKTYKRFKELLKKDLIDTPEGKELLFSTLSLLKTLAMSLENYEFMKMWDEAFPNSPARDKDHVIERIDGKLNELKLEDITK